MSPSDRSAGNCVGATVFQASAHKTPAMPAKNPDTASVASFTEAGLSPKAELARSLSRTATIARPGMERRSAAPVAKARIRTTRAT